MYRLRFALLALLGTAVILCAPPAITPENSEAARAKIERISEEQLAPGETVILTEDELNSYLGHDYAAELPDGVRDLRVRLLQDQGVIHALIDLAKVGAGGNGSPSMIWTTLFGGERKLRAVCRYVSSDGQATVEIESAELDGTRIPQALLEWLVESIVSNEVEGFELGKPYPLGANLEQILLEPGRAVITAR